MATFLLILFLVGASIIAVGISVYRNGRQRGTAPPAPQNGAGGAPTLFGIVTERAGRWNMLYWALGGILGFVLLFGLLGWIPTPSPEGVVEWSGGAWLFVILGLGFAVAATSGGKTGSVRAKLHILSWAFVALFLLAMLGTFAESMQMQQAAEAVKTRAALVAVQEANADLACDGQERNVYVPPHVKQHSRFIFTGNTDIVPTIPFTSGRYAVCTDYDVCYTSDTPVDKMQPAPRWYFKTTHAGDGFSMGYHCIKKGDAS
ncbi:MAG: hypothetical protein KGI41_00145 [Patescibacteria group bacterium]|nr:hypothetical protein [Patescibacteria group bacterium]MDE1965642.1 hypothetical protein [Patescibacteria group bacterium]